LRDLRGEARRGTAKREEADTRAQVRCCGGENLSYDVDFEAPEPRAHCSQQCTTTAVYRVPSAKAVARVISRRLVVGKCVANECTKLSLRLKGARRVFPNENCARLFKVFSYNNLRELVIGKQRDVQPGSVLRMYSNSLFSLLFSSFFSVFSFGTRSTKIYQLPSNSTSRAT